MLNNEKTKIEKQRREKKETNKEGLIMRQQKIDRKTEKREERNE